VTPAPKAEDSTPPKEGEPPIESSVEEKPAPIEPTAPVEQ